MINFIFFTILLIEYLVVDQVNSHGMMLNPVGRQSRWRYNPTAPVNYNDNQLFCGGFADQWYTNGGKCGLCGDSYSLPIPRPHELGGQFGQGAVVATYRSGSKIEISVQITANHRGYFYYDICNIDHQNENEDCFKQNLLKLVTGEDRYMLPSETPGNYVAVVQLPNNFICQHCVLRWTYVTGNNWGICANGNGELGCGPQENFRSCADISISP